MLERVTALLAQAAATILVVIGLVAILGYTHSRAYRAGYCATQYCPDQRSDTRRDDDRRHGWWPFGRDRTDRDRTGYAPSATTGPTRVEGRPPAGGPVIAGTGDYRRTDPSAPVDRFGSPVIGPVVGSGRGPGSAPDSGAAGMVAGGSYGNYESYGAGGYGYNRPGYGYGFDPGRRICASQRQQAGDADIARCWLRVGDAYQAVGRIEEARQAWDEALSVGSSVGGAQASLVAHRRLQAAILERSCPTTQRSLERIAYGFDHTEDDGDIVDLDLRQRALAALGYYNGDVDGAYGPMTRRSVRDFQGDMGFDQTGVLTPQETVTLICHAALTARDTSSQNLIGIMFATGLGLEQNIDTALEWLEEAAERGHGGANFNLALIYGTGTVQGSYRLCGIVESPERADSYLRRAADLGHDRAIALRRFAGTRDEPAERWSRISDQLLREAQSNGDRFYLAWQRRVDEVRRANGQELNQPGCYQAAVDGTRSSQGGAPARRP